MSARVRRWLLLVGALIVAGTLAFPLREMIYKTVVVPAAFIAWSLTLFYRSFSQAVWWWLVIGIVFLMLVLSLVPRRAFRKQVDVKRKPALGQVEALAGSLRKAERGVYFKWVIANRLGKLAYQILLHRENGRPRSVFAPLLGVDWEPREQLREYLETGLHGSFADFPNNRYAFGTPPQTPLDLDIAEAVEFLESKVENGKQG